MAFRIGDHVLDLRRRELRRGEELVPVEPQVFDVLVHLVTHRDRVVTKHELLDEVWGDRFVSESALTSRIKAARRAVDDDGAAQRLIRTVHGRGYRFVGAVEDDEQAGEAATVPSPRPPEALPDQQVRFCVTGDGVRLAYAEVGAGPPLVKAANWLSHLEYDWESPVWAHWWRDLSRHHRLVRYDERGCGLSDWDVGEFSLDRWVADLEAVVDAVGLDRFPLLGISQGGPVAIAYAARHPERVSGLVLYGTYAQGRRVRAGTPSEADEAQLVVDLVRHGWGRADPAFRRVFAMQFMPEGTPEQWELFDELQRRSTSPENALRFMEAFGRLDVTREAAALHVPTLVLHARRDARTSMETGRQLAALIPGSRFVSVSSANHLLLGGEPAWPRFVDEVERFLADVS